MDVDPWRPNTKTETKDMLTKSLVVAATALAASAAISLPADAKPNDQVRGTVIFWLLDRNNDGAIDKSEVEALRTVIFDAVDTDHDGKVTREEFMAVVGDRGGPGPRHGRWDERGDRGSGPRDRDYADDGRGPGPDHGRWDERGHGPRMGGFAEHRGERMMDRLGIDADNGLNKDEFVAASPKLFERADRDGNGTVSQSEFEQASRHIGRLFILE
jgi:Ca2+-binding EF-hand superfamily protein